MRTRSLRDLIAGSPLEPAARALYHRLRPEAAKADRYDRLTVEVMLHTLTRTSNCIDVGAHRGAILKHMLRLAPEGQHYAFEPLPEFYALLTRRFPAVRIRNLALSDADGEANFQHVIGRPARSSLRQRTEERGRTQDIVVPTARLDSVIPHEHCVDFIKIDVEGAELQVLMGGAGTVKRNRPVIVFEHGVGAPSVYGPSTRYIYELLHDGCGLDVSRLDAWPQGGAPLSRDDFGSEYLQGRNYYFVAHPPR